MTKPNKIVNEFCSEINEGNKEGRKYGQMDKETKRKFGQMDKQTEGSMDRWTPVLSFFGSLAFSIKE